jgi:hypothetical protein
VNVEEYMQNVDDLVSRGRFRTAELEEPWMLENALQLTIDNQWLYAEVSVENPKATRKRNLLSAE